MLKLSKKNDTGGLERRYRHHFSSAFNPKTTLGREIGASLTSTPWDGGGESNTDRSSFADQAKKTA